MQHYNALVKVTSISFSNFIFLLEFFNLYDFRLNMGGAVGGVGGQCPSHFWDQRGTVGYRGERSNENDLCFYIRQSLFSTVQVTEF